MNRSPKSWLVLVATLAGLATVSTACNGGGGGGDPTPTPLDISATTYYTLSGDANALPGECWGFVLDDANNAFTQNSQVRFTFLDQNGDEQDLFAAPFTTDDGFVQVSQDGSTLTFGLGDPSYPCLWHESYYGLSNLDLTIVVEDGTRDDSIPSGLVFGALPVMMLGTSSAIVTDNVETGADFDFWLFRAGANNAIIAVTGSANTGGFFLPDQLTVAEDFSTQTPGWDVVIQPVGAASGVLYGHGLRQKGFLFLTSGDSIPVSNAPSAGFSYTLTLTSSSFPAAATAPGDTCTAAPLLVVPAGGVAVTVDNTGFAADYDPAGAQACASRLFSHPNIGGAGAGEGVDAPGKDFVYKVSVPAGETLVVGAQGDAVDVSLYVVEDANCVATPTTCLAAIDWWGNFADVDNLGTDSLHWTNTGAAPTVVNVVIDDFNAPAAATEGPIKIFIDVR